MDTFLMVDYETFLEEHPRLKAHTEDFLNRVYDRDGNPQPYSWWVWILETQPQYKIVKQETIRGCMVSTVWLGMDHSFLEGGPPVIFETMIFGDRDWSGEYQNRYSTEEEALAGHKEAVLMVDLGVGDLDGEG